MNGNHCMNGKAAAIVVGLTVLSLCWASGCTGKTKRMDLDQGSDADFGTGVNSQDFRSISQRMARSMVQLPQIQNAKTPPKVAFSQVINNSNDLIDGDAFLRKMRTELIKNSEGRIVFLDRAIIDEVERENRDKDRGRRTTAGNQTPLGADFFLTGTIDSIDKVAGGGRTTYMRLSFRLTDASNSAVVWEDEYEMKKHSTTGIMRR
jgi:PBP1b-binding outer membrane lipoprotein LpoB